MEFNQIVLPTNDQLMQFLLVSNPLHANFVNGDLEFILENTRTLGSGQSIGFSVDLELLITMCSILFLMSLKLELVTIWLME